MSSPERTKSSRPNPIAVPVDDSSPDLVEVPEATAGASVETPDRAPAAPATAQHEPAKSDGMRRYLIWALVLISLVCALALLKQVQYANRLESTVGTLTAELEGALNQIDLHEAKLGQVRVQVGDIFDRVGTLRALVSEESMAAGAEAADADPVISDGTAGSAASAKPAESTDRDPMAAHSTDGDGASGAAAPYGQQHTGFDYGSSTRDLPRASF